MNIKNSQFPSIEQLQDQYLSKQKTVSNEQKSTDVSFEEILTRQQDSSQQVKFSKHAANRLSDRNIELSDEQMERLSSGTQKANAKGIKESLVLVDELAFIVNTKSNMVITAMNQAETDENIFTNIDGAVII